MAMSNGVWETVGCEKLMMLQQTEWIVLSETSSENPSATTSHSSWSFSSARTKRSPLVLLVTQSDQDTKRIRMHHDLERPSNQWSNTLNANMEVIIWNNDGKRKLWMTHTHTHTHARSFWDWFKFRHLSRRNMHTHKLICPSLTPKDPWTECLQSQPTLDSQFDLQAHDLALTCPSSNVKQSQRETIATWNNRNLKQSQLETIATWRQSRLPRRTSTPQLSRRNSWQQTLQPTTNSHSTQITRTHGRRTIDRAN